MPAADLHPPANLAWWVLAVGIGLLLLVVVWYLLVFRTTRAPRPAAPQELTRGERDGFDDRVVALHERYRSAEIDLRGLHLELARTMRAYATLRLGRDVGSWTASEIAAAQPGANLGELLAEWEEPSFARRSDAEAQRAIGNAREVVARW